MPADKNAISILVRNLRLPLLVGIVYFHTHFFKYVDQTVLDSYTVFSALNFVFTDIIFQCCVPLFFVFSGYFFFHERTLTPQLYAQKLKKRVFSLLIPYIIWNALVLLVMYLQEGLMGSTSSRMGVLHDYSISDWIYAFFDNSHSWSFTGPLGQPASVQFWFIRDLLILSVLSPILLALTRLNRYMMLGILLFIFFFPYHLPHLNNSSITFFGLGVFLQLYDIDFTRPIKRFSICQTPLFPPIVEKSCFFVFAYHVIPTAILCRMAMTFIPLSDFSLISLKILIPTVVILLGIAIYAFLSHFFPRITSILTGSR